MPTTLSRPSIRSRTQSSSVDLVKAKVTPRTIKPNGHKRAAPLKPHFDLSSYPVLDVKLGLKNMSGNKSLFIDICKVMKEEEIPTEKAAFVAAYTQKNWREIEQLAHKMRGGALYAGMTKMENICRLMEQSHQAGQTDVLEQLYQNIMRVFDETEAALVEWLTL